MSEPLSQSGGAQPALARLQFPYFIEVLLTIAVTFALLIPCFWQSHIEAGDLSSHLYNAWLAGKIKEGSVSGLTLVPSATNVLADWALEKLLPVLGVAGTERVVVGSAVLLFFWSAFWLISAVTGRRPWLLAPCVAMLAYGLVLQLGFLNFYISTGLCLCILALLWQPSRGRVLLSIPLAILALLAHVFPLVWAISVFLYLRFTQRFSPRKRPLMLLPGIGGIVLLQTALMSQFPSRWSLGAVMNLSGIAGITGVEQVWLFGPKYLIVAAGLLLIWCVLFLERLDRGDLLADPIAQLWFLHIVSFVLIPSAIQFPQTQHVLAYIPQRISLFTALILCIMVGSARHGRGMTRLLTLVGAVYFTFLYLDDRAYNRVEREVTALVETVPRGSRVVAAVADADTRVNALIHVVDRACIGRCFSYGNYEPATAQFRIRVLGPNRMVAPDMAIVQEIEEGRHIVTAEESPLYSICQCGTPEPRFCLRSLSAGERTCGFSLPLSPRLWSGLPSRPGGPWLARKDQTQIPDHDAGVPIVDQVDYARALEPHAEAAQEKRHQLGAEQAGHRPEMHEELNERARLDQSHPESDPSGQQIQHLQIAEHLKTQRPGVRRGSSSQNRVHADKIGRASWLR